MAICLLEVMAPLGLHPLLFRRRCCLKDVHPEVQSVLQQGFRAPMTETVNCDMI